MTKLFAGPQYVEACFLDCPCIFIGHNALLDYFENLKRQSIKLIANSDITGYPVMSVI